MFIALHSPEGNLIWANRVAYGLQTKKIFNKAADLNIFDEDRAIWWNWFRRSLFEKEINDYSVRVKVPVKPGWVRISGKMGPVILDDKVVYVVTVCHDATFRENGNALSRFVLGSLEKQIIITLLAASSPLKGAAIGAKVNQLSKSRQASSTLRNVLVGLCDRRVLEHTPDGYTIAEGFRRHAGDVVANCGTDSP